MEIKIKQQKKHLNIQIAIKITNWLNLYEKDIFKSGEKKSTYMLLI